MDIRPEIPRPRPSAKFPHLKVRLSRGGKESGLPRAKFDRWNNHGYGAWTCADGREVLFNRFYEPLLQRRPGGGVEAADPTEWVGGIVGERWFYDGGTEAAKRRASERAMVEMGWRSPGGRE